MNGLPIYPLQKFPHRLQMPTATTRSREHLECTEFPGSMVASEAFQMKPWIKEDDDDEACGSGCIYIYMYICSGLLLTNPTRLPPKMMALVPDGIPGRPGLGSYLGFSRCSPCLARQKSLKQNSVHLWLQRLGLGLQGEFPLRFNNS